MRDRWEPASWHMDLAYQRPIPAAIGLTLDDLSRFLLRHGWWRHHRTPVWFLGMTVMRLGSQYLRRGDQRVIIDGELLSRAEVARLDRGEPLPAPQAEAWWRRLWTCIRSATSAPAWQPTGPRVMRGPGADVGCRRRRAL